MKKALIGVIVVVILAGGGWYAWRTGVFGEKLPPSEQVVAKAGGQVGVKGSASSAKFVVPVGALSGETKLAIQEVSKESWPAGTIGGLFKIEPSGTKFSAASIFTLRLTAKAPRGFTLAYWYPETKKWEDLKTIAVSRTEYRAQVTHLSYVGGHASQPTASARAAANGVSTPVAQGINSLLPTLGQIEQGQASGNMSDEQEADLWESVHEQLGTVADLAIALSQQNPSFQTLTDLLAVEALAQSFGFGDLADRLHKAAHENLDKLATKAIDECKARPGPAALTGLQKIIEVAQFTGFADIEARAKAVEPECHVAFKIEQTDRVPYTFSMPGIVQSSGTSTLAYVGQPSAPAAKGAQGWQTSWGVIQDSSGFSDTTVQINLGGVTSTPMSGQARTTDRVRMDFSLAGIKAGGKFPIMINRIGTYTQNNYIPPQEVLFKAGDWQSVQRVGESSTDTIGSGQLKIEGILQQDLGDKGALIGFGKSPFNFPGLVMNIPPLRITSTNDEESGGSGNSQPPLPSVPPPSAPPPASPPPTKGTIPLPDKNKKPVGAGGMPTDINEMMKQYQDLIKQSGLNVPQ